MSDQLQCYSPGDGTIRLAWVNEAGQAYGRITTQQEAQHWLDTNPRAADLREHWKVIVLDKHPAIVQKVRRISPQVIEIEGRRYRHQNDDFTQLKDGRNLAVNDYADKETIKRFLRLEKETDFS